MNPINKPVQRGPIRKRLGKWYFIWKRYGNWWLSNQTFAAVQQSALLPTLLFKHQSILLRQLKAVDMQLQYNKITNLIIAAQSIDGLVIYPGEYFSFWKRVGRPSRGKGYLTGLTLDNGKVSTGIGGGLCQMGNLLYWLFLHSPLTITERWRHSYDVFPDSNRTMPFGSGATVSYNYIDLQCKNETKQAFQINTWLTDTHLCGSIRTAYEPKFRYFIEERNHQIRGEVWGGYTRHNELIRKVIDRQTGELVREELVVRNHALLMYVPFLKAES